MLGSGTLQRGQGGLLIVIDTGIVSAQGAPLLRTIDWTFFLSRKICVGVPVCERQWCSIAKTAGPGTYINYVRMLVLGTECGYTTGVLLECSPLLQDDATAIRHTERVALPIGIVRVAGTARTRSRRMAVSILKYVLCSSGR